jgi:hypothetical protein
MTLDLSSTALSVIGCFELRSGQTDRVTAPHKTPIGIDRDADTPTSFKHRM